ncbi:MULTISPECIES: hypothetical protein [Bacillus]|uniref:hypothetical protein n=1 Tax=Bacillus TaxID=1386 RepID=UPI001C24F99F|nr:hypothetical protein [Bacillus pumilus]MBU8573737.1 hypothetical protein [Bacillus pumilus]
MVTKPKYQNYRTCKTLSGETVYELNKYCQCPECRKRSQFYREPANRLCVTVKNIADLDNASLFLKDWSCNDGNKQLETLFVKL